MENTHEPCLCRFGLVIPMFNEADGIPALLDACRELQSVLDVHIVLVENGSRDDSSAVLKRSVFPSEAISVVHLEDNLGYGGGILAGLAVAPGRALGWTHADLQTPLADAATAFLVWQRDAHRLVKGYRHERRFAARLLTASMTIFESLLFRAVLRDINGQPTVFARDFYETWKNPPQDLTLDLYAMVMAKRQGRKIERFRVEFLERRFGESSWNRSVSSRCRTIGRTLGSSLVLWRATPWN